MTLRDSKVSDRDSTWEGEEKNRPIFFMASPMFYSTVTLLARFLG